MKRFEVRELPAAVVYAKEGGQALHVCPSKAFVTGAAPKCFRDSEEFAHLLDWDPARLKTTARKLGVRVVVIERAGTEMQHVDLCKGPLSRALALCQADAALPAQGVLAI